MKKYFEGNLLSDCCHAEFNPLGFQREDGLWDEECSKCHKPCDPIWVEDIPEMFDFQVGTKVIHHKTFPYLITLTCKKCGEESLFSIRFQEEEFDDVEIKRVLKLRKRNG